MWEFLRRRVLPEICCASYGADSREVVNHGQRPVHLFAGDDEEEHSQAAGTPTQDPNEAACAVQSAFRGHSVRKQLENEKLSATNIEAAFRGHMVRKSLAQEKHAATQIQAAVRGHQTRQDYDGVVSPVASPAALKASAEKAAASEAAAATAIQSAIRGSLVRMQFEGVVSPTASNKSRRASALALSVEQEAAATAIQAAVRGSLTRKQFEGVVTPVASVKGSRAEHGEEQDDEGEEEEEEEGTEADKEIDEREAALEAAAVTIQAVARGSRVRQQFEGVVSPTATPAAVRAVAEEHKKMDEAAVTIQALARGSLTRKSLEGVVTPVSSPSARKSVVGSGDTPTTASPGQSPPADAANPPANPNDVAKGKGKGKVQAAPVDAPNALGAPATRASVGKGAPKGGPKGGGKGKAGPEGGGKGANGSQKPKVQPTVPMKPLWWKKVPAGSSVWSKVTEVAAFPTGDLEARFGKAAAAAPKPVPGSPERPKAAVRQGTVEHNEVEKARQLSVLDLRYRAAREPELKRLPPASTVQRAIEELADEQLTIGEIERIREFATPQDNVMELIKKSKEASPDLPLAALEEYTWAVGSIPGHSERLECWSFVRSCSDRIARCTTILEDFSDVIKPLKNSEALITFLGITLAFGNHLNGGSDDFGQADGFDLTGLDLFGSVLDGQGKDVRGLLLDVFFKQFGDESAKLLSELLPLFLHVGRGMSTSGADPHAKVIQKTVLLKLEDCEQAVASLQQDLEAKKKVLAQALEAVGNSSDVFTTRMPAEFEQATSAIASLAELSASTRQSYAELLASLSMGPIESDAFFMLWDNFFVPSKLLEESKGAKEQYCKAVFCAGEPFDLDDLMVLWDFEAPDLGSRQPLKRPHPGEYRSELRTRRPKPAEPKALIPPRKALVALPWQRLHRGSTIQEGSIWEEVGDERDLVPAAELESRFTEDEMASWMASRGTEAGLSEEEEKAAAAVARLPDAADITKAISALDEKALSQKELSDFLLVCRKPPSIDESDEEGVKEQVANFLRKAATLPSIFEQASCWNFVRGVREATNRLMDQLESVLDIVDCITKSEAFPELLGLILTVGNYLNGGTNRGQADGFEVAALGLLESIKDANGKDVRHFVLDFFFHQESDKARAMVYELFPVFHAVVRRLEKNAIGTESFEKELRVLDMASCVAEVQGLRQSLQKTQTLAQAAGANLGANTAFRKKMPQMLDQAGSAIEELATLQQQADACLANLWEYLGTPKQELSELCKLFDDFLIPGELIANRGLPKDLIEAFTSGESFSIDHLKAIWGLESSALSTSPKDQGGGGAAGADTAAADAKEPPELLGEDYLDAEAFCRALAPTLRYPEEFASAAQTYSACLGTKELGGDLGDVERGSMHPGIEALLFDSELELGKVLGPVETEAGWHLVMAMKKTRGMLSTTVKASHLLIAPGRYEPPATEEVLALATAGPTSGEEGHIMQTCRRWSFAASLPRGLGSALSQEAAAEESLLKRRQALQDKPGLTLLFRWKSSFISATKGLLSELPTAASGSLTCSINGEKTELGRLLAATDPAIRQLQLQKGLESRLQWLEDGWQEAEPILGPDGSCEVLVSLTPHQSPGPSSSGPSRKSSWTLKIRPTLLAYAASQPNLRLALCTETERHQSCATLVRALDDGKVAVRVDNDPTDKEVVVDPRPTTVLLAANFEYPAGKALNVLQDSGLVDAVVVSHLSGNRHKLKLTASGSEVTVDLNETNHCSPLFDNAAAFETQRVSYCKEIMKKGSTITDAITGNCLRVDEQLVRLVGEDVAVDQVDPAAVAKMPFDDLEWVEGAEICLQSRVWAQGGEGYVEHMDRQGHCIVRLADGSSTPPLPRSMLQAARPIAGVRSEAFEEVQTIRDLVPLLLSQNKLRLSGARSTQPILVRAGPGTGKSWSMQQLVYFLSEALVSEQQLAQPVPLVPLLLPIQKLARMLRQQSRGGSTADFDGNLVRFFIKQDDDFSAETRQMLLQALEMRTLVILMDGVDEAANVKQAVEDFVTKQLLPMGIPLVLTSRPEGIRKRLYARDFVIMNLQPLSTEEQHHIAEMQLRGDALFEHLAAHSLATRAGDAAGAKEHRTFIQTTLGVDDVALQRRLTAFEEISEKPVLLSVLVCLLKGSWGHVDELPNDKFELYEQGIRAKVAQDLKKSQCKFAIGQLAREEALQTVLLVEELLQTIATANHLAKRRTFQLPDVHRALARARNPKLEELWNELLASGEVPLVKILTLGEAAGGEFQFCHLSFQEFLFVRKLCRGDTVSSFWAEDMLNVRLNDPFYKNALALGRGHLGQALAKQQPHWNFDRHPRLSPLGLEGLEHLLAGASSLESLNLANVALETPDVMESLAAAIALEGLPSLKRLSLRYCRLPAKASTALGGFLARCPALEDLDLEWNRELLSTGKAAACLSDTLAITGLPNLRRLNLRWCHLPAVVEHPLGTLLARCPNLTEVDLLGNRRMGGGGGGGVGAAGA